MHNKFVSLFIGALLRAKKTMALISQGLTVVLTSFG